MIILMIAIAIASSVFIFDLQVSGQESYSFPSWIKNNAKWWSQGQISDDDYINGMQYLMQKGIVQIPTQGQSVTGTSQTITKNNAGLWAAGHLSNDEFVKGIQYLIQSRDLKIPQSNSNNSESVTNKMANDNQVLTDSDLLAISDNTYADGNIPLGDGKYVTSGPKKGYIYLCNVPPMGQGAQSSGPWIHGNTWNFLEKLSVSGSVSWPNAMFTNVVSGNTRTLSGNDLPISHTTGTFPISSSDPVSKYDMNPNSISIQSYDDNIPVNPVYSETPYCIRGEVGIMLSGVPLFDGFDAELRDAQAHEAQDSCSGHPQNSGEYHYHGLSSCFKDINEKTVLGYALDGFPITGPQVAANKYLKTDDLDECHGITSEIIENGAATTTYHYVMTYDFPYSASCFRGKPAEYMVISNGQTGQNSQGSQGLPNQNVPNQNGPTQGHTPPQEAITACSGKSSGDLCSFTSPHGDMISGTCQTPPGNLLACIPR
ncbi:MAG TPA: YHYH protein [Nitrosopumilaceae archaeon]|nr:YHYH protein [Nitrosopumilaceae archaeon]